MPTLTERLQAAAGAFAQRKAASAGPPGGTSLGSSWFGGPYTTDSWGAHVAPSPVALVEQFKSIAYSCATRNADAVSAVPLRLYLDSTTGKKPNDFNDPREVSLSVFRAMRDTGAVASGTKVASIKELRQHRFLNTLDHPDPNGDFDRVKLLKLICLYCDIVGQAYFYPESAGGGVYTSLWPLFSQYVLPVRDGSSPVVRRYQYFGSSLDRDEVVRFGHGISLKDPYGANFSPLYAAVEYARLEDRFVSVQEQLLAMGPRPNMIATPKDAANPPGPAEKDRFEQDLIRKHARSAQGGILVTTGAWDFMPTAYSPTDLSGLKIAEYDWQAMCASFGVPYEFFTTDTNLANQQAAREKHAEHGVRPRCTMIAGMLTRIVQQWDRRLFFRFDDPIRLNELDQAKVIDMAVRNGTMTINQANEETGRPPADYGDEPWQPNTLSQPSMAKRLNEATIAMSQAGAVGLKEGGGNPAVGNKDVKKDKSKGGPNGKKKPDASRSLPRPADDDDDLRPGDGVLDQGDASVHGVEGLNAEGEERDPFAYLAWSADPHSAAGG